MRTPFKSEDTVRERIYLGLGSNLGDREANLRHALEMLGTYMALERTSSFYDTEPWGYRDQPRFLNCVCEGRTNLSPPALLTGVKQVERVLGRKATFSNGPRLIDVDILLYGQTVVSEPGLEIPHPRLAQRAFVLVPLRELAGDFVHPVLKLTVEKLLERAAETSGDSAGSTGTVKLWAPPIALSRRTS